MLKRVVRSLGLVEQIGRDPRTRRKNHPRGAESSQDFSLKSNDRFVRIVHAGGQEELYQHAIAAFKLMEKYPGMCVALPEVFKAPHQSVLWPDDFLIPGQKYIIIDSRAVEKLKRKYPDNGKTREPENMVDAKITKSPGDHKVEENGAINVPDGVSLDILEEKTTTSSAGTEIEEMCKTKDANGEGQEILLDDTNIKQSLCAGTAEDSLCSAKDFYVSKEKWTKYSKRRGIKGRKPFVPPLPDARSCGSVGWKPRLATVEEISP